MKLAVVPETLVERLLVRLGWVPSPLVHTQVAYTLARTIMAAVRANVFEVLASEPLTAEQTAERCGTHLRATRALLNALVGVGYLKYRHGVYVPTPVARRWLLASSAQSLRDKLLMQIREWDFVAHRSLPGSAQQTGLKPLG